MGTREIASRHTEKHINELTDWHGQTLTWLRNLDAAPEVTEEKI